MQNESPVRFEDIEILSDQTATMPLLNWKLRNDLSKTVKRFVVVFKIRTSIDRCREFGAGQTEYDVGTNEKNDLIPLREPHREYNYSNSPLMPKDLMNGLFSFDADKGEKTFIVVHGMIRKVFFDDGSVYEENDKVFSEF